MLAPYDRQGAEMSLRANMTKFSSACCLHYEFRVYDSINVAYTDR